MSTQLQTQAKAGSKTSDALTANNAVKRNFSSQRGFSDEAQRYPIQAKLKIGQPGDKYEQEADRVAEQVMMMPEPQCLECEEETSRKPLSIQRLAQSTGHSIHRQCTECEEELQRQPVEEEEEIQLKPLTAQITPLVQRQPIEEEEEELQMKPLAGQITPLVQRQVGEEEGEEEPIMIKGISSGTQHVRDDLYGRLNQSRSGGQPLPEANSGFLERRFGSDFSGVRVHTDSNAVQMNRDLNAQAFTHGRDIYFGELRYNPDTSRGKRLLAHELTHVIQQRAPGVFVPEVQRLVRNTRVTGCGANNPRRAERRAAGILTRAMNRVQNAINNRAANPANTDVLAVRRAVWRAFRFGNNNRTWNIRLPIIRRRIEIALNYINSVVFQYECCPVGGPCPISTCGPCRAGEEAATCAGNATYIALCPLFWAATRNRNQRARILAHEVFHINFGFIQDWTQPDFHNAHCYAQFVALLNGFNSLPGYRCH